METTQSTAKQHCKLALICFAFLPFGVSVCRFQLFKANPSKKFIISITPYPSDWFQLVAAVSGLNEGEGQKVYINGALAQQDTTLQDTGYAGNERVETKMGALNVQFDVDDLAIWMVELSSAQISALYSM